MCTNPNDRWCTDSNKNVQFSCCIDSSKVKSNEKWFSHLKNSYFVLKLLNVTCQTTRHCVQHPAWNETPVQWPLSIYWPGTKVPPGLKLSVNHCKQHLCKATNLFEAATHPFSKDPCFQCSHSKLDTWKKIVQSQRFLTTKDSQVFCKQTNKSKD